MLSKGSPYHTSFVDRPQYPQISQALGRHFEHYQAVYTASSMASNEGSGFVEDFSNMDFSNLSDQQYLSYNDILESYMSLNQGGLIEETSRESDEIEDQANAADMEIRADQYNNIQEETTLSLGIARHLESMEKQIEEMKLFLRKGFVTKDNRDMEIERLRLQSRDYNFRNITEIEELFQTLPRSDGAVPRGCPQNGVELKGLTHKQMDLLLDEYDIPFNPSMFLYEKQLAYLRFIGANRAIMHRVID